MWPERDFGEVWRDSVERLTVCTLKLKLSASVQCSHEYSIHVPSLSKLPTLCTWSWSIAILSRPSIYIPVKHGTKSRYSRTSKYSRRLRCRIDGLWITRALEKRPTRAPVRPGGGRRTRPWHTITSRWTHRCSGRTALLSTRSKISSATTRLHADQYRSLALRCSSMMRM
jgi:hypothetical protein